MADVVKQSCELLCRHRAPSLDWCQAKLSLLSYTTTRAETHIVKCTLYDIQIVKGMSALHNGKSQYICSNCIDNDKTNSSRLQWTGKRLPARLTSTLIPVNTCFIPGHVILESGKSPVSVDIPRTGSMCCPG
jgi:hypothetical protein